MGLGSEGLSSNLICLLTAPLCWANSHESLIAKTAGMGIGNNYGPHTFVYVISSKLDPSYIISYILKIYRCPHFLSIVVIKYTDQEPLGARVCYPSWFQVAVCHSGEVTVAEP